MKNWNKLIPNILYICDTDIQHKLNDFKAQKYIRHGSVPQ